MISYICGGIIAILIIAALIGWVATWGKYRLMYGKERKWK